MGRWKCRNSDEYNLLSAGQFVFEHKRSGQYRPGEWKHLVCLRRKPQQVERYLLKGANLALIERELNLLSWKTPPNRRGFEDASAGRTTPAAKFLADMRRKPV